jgi:hypothetical protein
MLHSSAWMCGPSGKYGINTIPSVTAPYSFIDEFGPPPNAPERLTIPFLVRTLCDEVMDRMGFFIGTPQIGEFLNPRFCPLIADANGGYAYVMWGRNHSWRGNDYEGLDRKPLLWIRHDLLQDFVDKILPKIDGPFVLMTTESDYSPIKHRRAATEALLASPKLHHWFVQQCDITRQDKVTPIPLGILYPYRHDLRLKKDLFGHSHLAIYDLKLFDEKLHRLLANRRPAATRKLMALADFALSNTSKDAGHGETRADIYDQLLPNQVMTVPERALDQLSLYHLYSQYGFVISPHGRGIDCYRTWEALLMGAIPIVKKSVLDPVYEGWPVVIVEDWREVTHANLEIWLARFAGAWQHQGWDERLTFAYWAKRLRDAAMAA